MVDANHLAPIWYKIVVESKEDFQPTLEDTCQATTWSLYLSLLVITHWVAGIVREFRFGTRDYDSLGTGASKFLFFAHMAAAAEKLRVKAHFKDNSLRENVRPMSE